MQLLLVAGLAIAVGGLLRELWLKRDEPFFWRPNRWVVLVVTLALAAPVIAAIVSYVDVSVYLPRNLATSWPGLAVSMGALVMASRVRLLRIASVSLIVFYYGFISVSMLDDAYQRPDYKGAAAFVADEFQPGDRIVEYSSFQPAPISPLDVPLDELRESQPDIAEVDRLGIPARELSDAAVQPGGIGRYAPLPIESAAALAERTGDLSGSERLFVVTPGGDPLAIAEIFKDSPLSMYIRALPKGVEPVEVETFPGFAGMVSVVVFKKKP
jgi:hypothetical protein